MASILEAKKHQERREDDADQREEATETKDEEAQVQEADEEAEECEEEVGTKLDFLFWLSRLYYVIKAQPFFIPTWVSLALSGESKLLEDQVFSEPH